MAEHRNDDGQRQDQAVSSGVSALIERLRDQGVAEGQARAEQIVAEAERRADWLVRQAHGEAERIVSTARAEAEQLETAGEEALRVAARDTVLSMKGTLLEHFADEIERLVARELRDGDFLERMIIEVVGRAREDSGLDGVEEVEVILPRDVVGLEELRRKPEELEQGPLSHFVFGVARELLRQGVTFKAAEDETGGIRVRLVEQQVQVELTDRAIAALLLEHLQPRFRAFVEGIVK